MQKGKREIKFKYYLLLDKKVINIKIFDIEDVEHINFNTILFMNIEIKKENFERMELHREQYTTIKDKNGVEIYEGDIINHNGFVGYVKYINSGNCNVLGYALVCLMSGRFFICIVMK